MAKKLPSKAAAMLLLGLLQLLVIYILVHSLLVISPSHQVAQDDSKDRSVGEHLGRMQHDVTALKVKVAALERGQSRQQTLEAEAVVASQHGARREEGATWGKGGNRPVQEAQPQQEQQEKEEQEQQEKEEQEEQEQEEQELKERSEHSFMLHRDSAQWRDDSAFCNLSQTFRVARMKTPVGSVRVHVHEPEQDRYVSKTLLRHGQWEAGLVQAVLQCLQADPALAFLDIGANVGVFTLTAARLGRRVVAVEPFPSNVQRLCRSVQDNQLQSRVTLVRNALSDARQLLSFKVRQDSVGHTQVRNASSGEGVQDGSSGEGVQAILLDDVAELLRGEQGVVIKMDVEGHEARVLGGAKHFFRQLRVPCLLMEWGIVKNSPAGSQAVLKFMAEHDLQPFNPEAPSSSLRTLPPGKWPGNVLWLKSGSE